MTRVPTSSPCLLWKEEYQVKVGWLWKEEYQVVVGYWTCDLCAYLSSLLLTSGGVPGKGGLAVEGGLPGSGGVLDL